jgi:drug/metabolite transporter (DMT)-like permease
MKNKRLTGLLLGMTATTFWASFYIVSRFLFGENEAKVDPLFLTFVRYLVAAVLLLAIMLYQKKMPVIRKCLKKDLIIFIFLGLTGVVLEGTLVFYSLKFTTVARSCLLANASPVFTVILAYFALNEGMSKMKITGMIIGFIGIFAAIFSRGGSDVYTSASAVTGDLMALVSGICWAAYTVWGVRVSNEYGGMVSGFVSILFGVVLMLPVVIIGGGNMSLDLPLRVWLGVIYLGIAANGIAYACWFSALKYLKAGELGALGYVSAAMAMTLSILLLQEKLNWTFLAAIVLVFYGVYLMIKNPPEKSKATTCQINNTVL